MLFKSKNSTSWRCW